jgi:hypothetical protein
LNRFLLIEAIAFTEALVVSYTVGEYAKKKIRKAVAKTQKFSGQLMELGNKKVERRIIIRSVIYPSDLKVQDSELHILVQFKEKNALE